MKLCVLGLGYVGLPLALALAKHYPTVGFDISPKRIAQLRGGHDGTGEVEQDELRESTILLTNETAHLKGCDHWFITVPTPVDAANRPDLSMLRSAARIIAPHLGRGHHVIVESSVYPGVTEDVIGAELSHATGLIPGTDFHLAHSPERANPGDREHRLHTVTKLVAGETPAVTEHIALIYEKATGQKIFRAASIKVAEMSKLLENTQRDVNIALVNEVAQICRSMGMSVHDVLAAAGTKWNFLPFTPGFVGGHCIGVDPYYVAEVGARHGIMSNLILAARMRNEGMPKWVADQITLALRQTLGRRSIDASILVLGITFKEDVPDIRNSKVVPMIRKLEASGFRVIVHDPIADAHGIAEEYGLTLTNELPDTADHIGIIGAVRHRDYVAMDEARLRALMQPGGMIFDLKRNWPQLVPGESPGVWVL